MYSIKFMYMNKRLRGIALFAAMVSGSVSARADVGIVIYESKGADARRTSTGHIALISTALCPAGIDHLRKCAADEEPGAVITRYANVAAGYDKSLFVASIRDHFTGTSDPHLLPVLSSGGTLEAMQMEYWRLHLKPYLPPISQAKYETMRADLDRFDAGRTFRRAITMDYLIALLGPHKKKYPTEPIAIIHPVTKELIPNGRWRESIGVQQMRNSIIITVPATQEQEDRLLAFIPTATPHEFNAMTDNCSDFVAEALVKVFGDSGMRLRPTFLHVADAWITTPLAVATDFTGFARRQKLPMNVTPVPMTAGTRRPTATITSISRGALVPDTSQGKMAFFMKIYFNTLNPLLGLTSFAADQATRFVDLQDLVHERGSTELSRISNAMLNKKPVPPEERTALKREQFRVFGSAACWESKRSEFALLSKQAAELGIMSQGEKSLLLKRGQPFLLPSLYEQTAAARGYDGVLMAGIETCVIPGCGRGMTSSLFDSNIELKDVSPGSPVGFVPGREEIREMAASEDHSKKIVAFKLMTAVINFDLSSEAVARRTSESFDPDWQLYLDVARKNDVKIPITEAAREKLADCSCNAFNAGKAKVDAFQQDRGVGQKLAREGRGFLFGANR
jgi:hypothetical protein